MYARLFIILLTLPLLLSSCIDEQQMADTPRGNLEALWKIMDRHYCFFGYKQKELGVDWNEVRDRYMRQVPEGSNISRQQLFEIMANMLGELRDGHVNLYSSFDLARSWSWREDYPSNLSDDIIDRYLGTDYRIASSLNYRILDDNVGYIQCRSFASPFGDGNLDAVLSYLAPCNGLILDLRGNGGGELTAAEKMAARFTNEETSVGFMQHKTGSGHEDFSSMQEQRIKPSSGLRWQKRLVVLTNREVFSAANEFVKYMKCFPGVTVIGDRTGGGGGMPMNYELPNGWKVRLSACPMFDKDRQSTEHGIAPDIEVSLRTEDVQNGRDTLIEYARKVFKAQ